jgi:hypothetical protein
LFLTLIPVLALLSNYGQENCLINVGTEGHAGGHELISECDETLPRFKSREHETE